MSEDSNKFASTQSDEAAPPPVSETESEQKKSISAWLARILKEDESAEETHALEDKTAPEEEALPSEKALPSDEASVAAPPLTEQSPVEILGAVDLDEPSQQIELGGVADGGGVYEDFLDLQAPAELLGTPSEDVPLPNESPESPEIPEPDPGTSLDQTEEAPSSSTQLNDSEDTKETGESPAPESPNTPPLLELPGALPLRNKAAKHELLASVPESQLETTDEPLKTERKPDKSLPGGELRALEQILSRSTAGKIPAGFAKRATLAVRFLFTMAGVERAMVVVENETGELKALAAGGMEEEGELEGRAPRGILRSVLSTKTTILLVDATKDPRFSHAPVVKEQGIRSILCVHFTDKIANTQGLLYADSLSTPDIFSLSEQKKVEDFARRLATEDILSEEKDLEPVQVLELQVETQPASPWLMVAGVLLALFLILPSLTKSDPKPTPTATATLTSHQNADARVVLESYIRSLGSSNFRGAYSMLSEKQKAAFTPEEFEKTMRVFFAKKDLAVQFANVKLSEKSSSSDTLKTFALQPPRRDLGPWEALLQRSEGVWYVSGIKGGPALP